MIGNGSKHSDHETIPLDIALDYPIGWSFRIVLRDLIQNFYDTLGPDEFGEKFSYIWRLDDEGKSYYLEMSIHDSPFSYEWLTYVGGSTKMDGDTCYVGQYGEGFKMSALRIVQMGGMELTMHSQDWKIRPVTYDEEIDGIKVPMLGYEYHEVEDDRLTLLTLAGIPLSERKNLENGRLDFFFEDNPLFGKKIGEGENYAIYCRSRLPIPCDQPDDKLKGILYVNHMARGRLDIPFCVDCQMELHGDKRSRPTLNKTDTLEYLDCSSKKWSAADSAEVLRILKPYWNDMIKGRYDLDSKYYLICQLVRNVSKDRKISALFAEEMRECGYIEKKGSDTHRNRLIDETKRWWMLERSKRLVNPIFRLLGAENLVDTYVGTKEKEYRTPNGYELKRYNAIAKSVVDTIPYLRYADIPAIVIRVEGDGAYDPLQFSERLYGDRKKRAGRKYRITRLVMEEEDFLEENRGHTFVKLADAFLHTYATSRSDKMNALLTDLAVWMLRSGAESIE